MRGGLGGQKHGTPIATLEPLHARVAGHDDYFLFRLRAIGILVAERLYGSQDLGWTRKQTAF
jgi:hypothetical protein